MTLYLSEADRTIALREAEELWEVLGKERSGFADHPLYKDLLKNPQAVLTVLCQSPHRAWGALWVDSGGVGEVGLQHCANALELMLSSGESGVEDAVVIRVIQYLLLKPQYWRKFRRYAGPVLMDVVLKESKYYWHQSDPVLG